MELFTAVELFTQVITYAMIAAGVPSCLDMLKTNNSHGFPYPFFLIGLLNSVLCVGYGHLVDNSTILQINAIATAFNIFYVLSFIYVSQSKSDPTVKLGVVSIMLGGLYYYLTHHVREDEFMNTLGPLLLFVSTAMMLTPLLQVKQCVDDRSAASISMVMLCAGTLCAGAWGTYGYLLKDGYIYGPNILGMMVNCCLWAVLLIYGQQPSKTSKLE